MKKRIDSQALLLMVCLIGVCLHSIHLLLNWKLGAFLLCGVFAFYLVLAVAKQGTENNSP